MNVIDGEIPNANKFTIKLLKAYFICGFTAITNLEYYELSPSIHSFK